MELSLSYSRPFRVLALILAMLPSVQSVALGCPRGIKSASSAAKTKTPAFPNGSDFEATSNKALEIFYGSDSDGQHKAQKFIDQISASARHPISCSFELFDIVNAEVIKTRVYDASYFPIADFDKSSHKIRVYKKAAFEALSDCYPGRKVDLPEGAITLGIALESKLELKIDPNDTRIDHNADRIISDYFSETSDQLKAIAPCARSLHQVNDQLKWIAATQKQRDPADIIQLRDSIKRELAEIVGPGGRCKVNYDKPQRVHND